MESFGGFGFSDMSTTVRKRRSSSSRRPRNDSQPFADGRENSSLSSTPPSDNVSRASSDDNNDHGTNSLKKERDLNQCSSRASSTNLVVVETALLENEVAGRGEFNEAHIKGNSERKHSSIYSYGPSGQSEVASDGPGTESDNKVKKVRLKVGGVTRTIHAKSMSIGTSAGGSSSRSSDAPRPRPKLILQDFSDDDDSSSEGKATGTRGVPWKDFSRSGFSVTNLKSSRGKKLEETVTIKQSDKHEPVRKSKRVPKRRLLGGTFDVGDDDDELRYLEKFKTSKVSTDHSAEYEDDEDVGSRKQLKMSKVLKINFDGRGSVDSGDYGSSRLGKEAAKRPRSGRASEDTDYLEEDELVSDGEPETRRKKQKKELVDVLGDPKVEMAITTRQRALQTGKDTNSNSSASLIEFPNGLPPAPPRKQKDKLTEVEQQLKKVEAAQRRRMQVEKAARESEAEAIRKILGQDSSRKRREDKMKKRQEELAQERAANALTLASDTVRWILGPSGTVVTFPDEIGLPSIFERKACSYPPPREKCAGPSCTNPYKYRDSKSKLPLCSLQCYKAIRQKAYPLTMC